MGAAGRPLDIECDLRVGHGAGEYIRVTGQGERVQVDLALSLFRRRSLRELPPRSLRNQWLYRAQTLLELSDLTVDLCVGGRRVGQLHRHSTGSWVGRWLGLGPIDIRFRDFFRALLERRG